jgi:aerobic-type carbon monoxide dehydrogenase small subunit (CoxS/CutS family)
MAETITLEVNGRVHHLQVDPETPLLCVLREPDGLDHQRSKRVKANVTGCRRTRCPSD